MPNNVARNDQQVDKVSWEDIHMGVEMLAGWCEETFPDKKVSIYGIPRGGMIPAVMLVHLLESKGWSARFTADLNHLMPNELHNLVVIDEICDSGDTFKVIKQLFPMAKTATLFHREGAAFQADYHSYIMFDDRWLQFPWELISAD